MSSHQLKKYGPQPLSFNDIAKLNLSQIVIFSKPPNIIATNISRFTVKREANKKLDDSAFLRTQSYITEI